MSKRIDRIVELQVYKWERQRFGSAQRSKKTGRQKTRKVSKDHT